MTRLRDFLARISISAALSWPTFWVAYGLNLSVTFVSALGGTPSWWQRVAAVTAAQLAMFGMLGLGLLVERRIGVGARRGLFALVWFALTGALRGAVVSELFTVWGVEAPDGSVPRILTGVAFGWVLLVPMSLVVGTARDYARTRAELLALRERLTLAADRISAEIDELEERSVEGVRQELLAALSEEDREMSARRLESVAADVVRPLSHELARAVPTWIVPDGTVAAGRVRWREVIDRAATGRPFQVVSTPGVIALLSFVAVVELIGLPMTLIAFALGFVCISGILWVANGVLQRSLDSRRLGARVTLVMVAAFVAGSLSGMIMVAIEAVLGLGITDSERVRLFVALLLVVPIFAIPLALARAARQQVEASLSELRAVDASLARQVARLGMVQWSQHRALARALHGPVQAIIAAGVVRLRATAGGERDRISERLQRDLLDVLDPNRRHEERLDWEVGVSRIQATWEGLASIEVATSVEADRALADDPVAADIVMEIVTEAVSNAIRHGKADQIAARIECRGKDLEVLVRNRGQRPMNAAGGLGTQLLRDCTITWDLRLDGEGVELVAILPTASAYS